MTAYRAGCPVDGDGGPVVGSGGGARCRPAGEGVEAGGGESFEDTLGGLGVFLGVMLYRRWQRREPLSDAPHFTGPSLSGADEPRRRLASSDTGRSHRAGW